MAICSYTKYFPDLTIRLSIEFHDICFADTDKSEVKILALVYAGLLVFSLSVELLADKIFNSFLFYANT